MAGTTLNRINNGQLPKFSVKHFRRFMDSIFNIYFWVSMYLVKIRLRHYRVQFELQMKYKKVNDQWIYLIPKHGLICLNSKVLKKAVIDHSNSMALAHIEAVGSRRVGIWTTRDMTPRSQTIFTLYTTQIHELSKSNGYAISLKDKSIFNDKEKCSLAPSTLQGSSRWSHWPFRKLCP